jgi:hypothetical protein
MLLVLLVCVSALCLAGCGTPEDRAMVQDFVEDWVRSKKMHPINEDGGLSLEGVWNLGTRLVTGSTGDAETDAILDAYQVIDNMHRADKLMDEGRDARDASKMDQAIAMRPGDWTYRVSRAGLALEQGDVGQYNAQFDAARAGSQDKAPLWFVNESIGELEQVEDKVAMSGFSSSEQCRALYGSLAELYVQRADLTNSLKDREQAADVLVLRETCDQ